MYAAIRRRITETGSRTWLDPLVTDRINIAMPTEENQPALATEQYAAILQSIADGVFTVDRDFYITSFNRAAERITGFSAAEAIGQRCYNIFRTSVCQGGCLLDESIKTGREITGLELTILNRRNQEIPISVSTAVLFDHDDHPIGGVETFRDLTAVEGLRREIRERYCLGDMISKNHRLRDIFALVPDVANSRAAVLIQGETGTGKELLARALHNESSRRDGPFVKVNCGALPDSLLESELFGHVAGAFTDAKADRIGRFEQAAGGTIFLDEIGDTSPAMQVKLLHVLQDGTFDPVGSGKSRKTDAWVIAATHRDLKTLVADETFREDLYYRINTVSLVLPPLRDRREDIPLLVEHFVEHFNHLTGKEVRTLSGEAMQLMMKHSWPGNVRELEHSIEHAFVLVKGSAIDIQHLPESIASMSSQSQETAQPSGAGSLADGERHVIEATLERHKWNRNAAAHELGLSRTTLWRKMRKLGIGS